MASENRILRSATKVFEWLGSRMIGQTISHFRITAKLGEGGMRTHRGPSVTRGVK